MNHCKTIIFILLFSLAAASSFSDTTRTIYPTRIEGKLGVPNALGLSYEYLFPWSPFAGTSLAFNIDATFFYLDLMESSSFRIDYILEEGLYLKLYFSPYGDGFYFKTGYARIDFRFSRDDQNNDTFSGTISDISTGIGWRWFIGSFTIQLGTGFSYRFASKYDYDDYYSEIDTLEMISEGGIGGILYSLNFEFSMGGSF